MVRGGTRAPRWIHPWNSETNQRSRTVETVDEDGFDFIIEVTGDEFPESEGVKSGVNNNALLSASRYQQNFSDDEEEDEDSSESESKKAGPTSRDEELDKFLLENQDILKRAYELKLEMARKSKEGNVKYSIHMFAN